MRKPIVWVAVIGVIALIVVGFIFSKAPQPGVSIKAEEIFSVGPLKITNTLITAYLVTLVLAVLSWMATRKASLVPSGFYNFIEAIVEWMMGTVDEIAGESLGRRFFPFVGTIFLFIIACNYFGLLPIVGSIGDIHHTTELQTSETRFVASGSTSFAVINPGADEVKGDTPIDPSTNKDAPKISEFRPFLRSPNTDANAPLAIALASFIAVEYWGISSLGFKYFGKFLAFPPFAKGVNPINIFVGILELLSEFIRIISFTFRLFGNIIAGDVLILFISFLVPFIAPMVFYGLETFVGFIQAAVFALLTLVFAVMAVESHSEGEHEAHDTHGAQAEAATH